MISDSFPFISKPFELWLFYKQALPSSKQCLAKQT